MEMRNRIAGTVSTNGTAVSERLLNARKLSLTQINVHGRDVSRVPDFGSIFQGHNTFNEPINGWDVSAATSMSQVFRGASTFNQDLSGWNTAGVTRFDFTFDGASAFDQDLSSWDASAATDFRSMFQGASSMNSPLFGDVSSGTIFFQMFYLASSFAQDLCTEWEPDIRAKAASGASINVNGMFLATSCPTTSDPVVSTAPISPLCYVCT